MFLSVEGVNPKVELERRRQVQGLINDSWRDTKYINAVLLTQMGEQWVAEREVRGSDPSRTNHPMSGSLNKLVKDDRIVGWWR